MFTFVRHYMNFILSKVFVNIKAVLQNYCTQCLYWLNFFFWVYLKIVKMKWQMLTGPEDIKLFSCSTQLSTNFQPLIKLKYRQIKKFLALSLRDVVFIMLINVKMPTIAGILTFMSWINFLLWWVEHEIKFYNLGARCWNISARKNRTTVCMSNRWVSKWASILHKVQIGMCIQQRFIFVCASIQFDQSWFFNWRNVWPLATQRLIRLCGCLRWMHMPACTFRWTPAQMSRDLWFPTMWHFDKCRNRWACAASF